MEGPGFSPSMLVPGTLLAGKYRVERVLGEGGMGVVLAAHHVALDERVAIKLLRGNVLGRPDVVERFLREGRNAVKLRSQHVARVLDVGTLDGGAPYLVLEYLEGVDIDQMIRRDGNIPYVRAVGLLLQACEAVAEAHARGIVHRDLKPHNLFLTTGIGGADLLKVLDFGIAKSSNMQGGVLTRTDSSVGSPLYMSPEQMRSPKDIDARTDVWSLGVTLYEMISGQPPFNAETFPELVLRVTEGKHVPLVQVVPNVPAELSEVISRCMICDREQRVQTIADLATALEPFAAASAHIYAENARRASGLLDSAQRMASVSPASAALRGASVKPNVPVPPATMVESKNSGPNAWSGSASETAPTAKRRTPLIAGASGVVVIAAAAGLYAARPNAPVDIVTPSASASTSAAASATSASTTPRGVRTVEEHDLVDAAPPPPSPSASAKKVDKIEKTPAPAASASARKTDRPTASNAPATPPPPNDGIPRQRE